MTTFDCVELGLESQFWAIIHLQIHLELGAERTYLPCVCDVLTVFSHEWGSRDRLPNAKR